MNCDWNGSNQNLDSRPFDFSRVAVMKKRLRHWGSKAIQSRPSGINDMRLSLFNKMLENEDPSGACCRFVVSHEFVNFNTGNTSEIPQSRPQKCRKSTPMNHLIDCSEIIEAGLQNSSDIFRFFGWGELASNESN
jgi:hypothetical protein